MDELIIADQKYISSKHASEITGYAKDYIGQLCREGRVEARLVGRSWYVREAAIRDHRFGAENSPPEPEKIEPVVETALETSESPKYITDDSGVPEATTYFDTAAQMQEAWQGWFSKNKREEHAEEIEIQKIPDSSKEGAESGGEAPVFIQKMQESPLEQKEEKGEVVEKETFLEQERAAVKVKPVLARTRSPSYSVSKAVLVLVGAVSIIIASLGTGIFHLERSGATAAVVNYLAGVTLLTR